MLLEEEIDKIVREVMIEYTKKMYDEAQSNIKVSEWRNSGSYEVTDDMITLAWTDIILIYNAFGTGDSATKFLSDKPDEIKKEARKFFVSGKGKLPTNDMIYSAILKYQEQIIPEINRRVENWFKGVKL